jgi:hypothetical protein
LADDLPKGAVVLGRRTVITHDGEMLGRYKINQRALVRLRQRYDDLLITEARCTGMVALLSGSPLD